MRAATLLLFELACESSTSHFRHQRYSYYSNFAVLEPLLKHFRREINAFNQAPNSRSLAHVPRLGETKRASFAITPSAMLVQHLLRCFALELCWPASLNKMSQGTKYY